MPFILDKIRTCKAVKYWPPRVANKFIQILNLSPTLKSLDKIVIVPYWVCLNPVLTSHCEITVKAVLLQMNVSWSFLNSLKCR